MKSKKITNVAPLEINDNPSIKVDTVVLESDRMYETLGKQGCEEYLSADEVLQELTALCEKEAREGRVRVSYIISYRRQGSAYACFHLDSSTYIERERRSILKYAFTGFVS